MIFFDELVSNALQFRLNLPECYSEISSPWLKIDFDMIFLFDLMECDNKWNLAHQWCTISESLSNCWILWIMLSMSTDGRRGLGIDVCPKCQKSG